MTSAEFTAKYRVLKTLTEHGARSQIAQEVALGRMVMVHHLDVGSVADQQRLIAGVGNLDAAAAAKVFEVVTVDGTQVIVTHFLATFTDLPTWLDQNAGVLDAKTVIIPAQTISRPAPAPVGVVAPPTMAPIAPPPPPPPPPTAVPAVAPPPGEFTRMFQAVKTPPVVSAPSVSPPAFSPPPAPAPVVTPPATPAKPEASFTSVFGQVQAPIRRNDSPPPALRQAPPAAPGAPRFESIMPPVEPPAPRAPVAPPPQAPQINPASNEFNSLFARLEMPGSAPMPAPPAFAPPPFAPPNVPQPNVAPPSAQLPPIPSWQAPPVPQAPPIPPGPPRPVVSPMPSALGGAPAAAGPSEFTRVLGRVQQPSAPPTPQLPPVNAQAPGFPTPAVPQPQAPQAAAKPAKSYVPLIIALNVVLIGGIAVVLYFVLKR